MATLVVAVVLPGVVAVVDVAPPLLWLPSSTIHSFEQWSMSLPDVMHDPICLGHSQMGVNRQGHPPHFK